MTSERLTQDDDLGSGFRALFGGTLLSNAGDGIRLALTLTDSAFLISLVTAAQYLPWLVFAPVGGALVDRWSRRRTILVDPATVALVPTVVRDEQLDRANSRIASAEIVTNGSR